jgi:hypothetical protein
MYETREEIKERLGMSEEECRDPRGWRRGMATYLDDQVAELETRVEDLELQIRLLTDIVDSLGETLEKLEATNED